MHFLNMVLYKLQLIIQAVVLFGVNMAVNMTTNKSSTFSFLNTL